MAVKKKSICPRVGSRVIARSRCRASVLSSTFPPASTYRDVFPVSTNRDLLFEPGFAIQIPTNRDLLNRDLLFGWRLIPGQVEKYTGLNPEP